MKLYRFLKENNPEVVRKIFADLLPLLFSEAEDIVTKKTESQIAAIVISEVGDGDLALQYIESFQIQKIAQNRRIVRFSAVSPRVQSMEVGVDTFSIKDKMLQAGRAGVKMSKDGYLYRTVPISKDVEKSVKKSASAKEKAIQAQLREVIANANFAIASAWRNKKTEEYTVLERASGLSRYSTFESKAAFQAGAKSKRSKVVIFRTMSSRPGTSEWQHPGFDGKHIQKKVEQWLRENEDSEFDAALEELMENIT